MKKIQTNETADSISSVFGVTLERSKELHLLAIKALDSNGSIKEAIIKLNKDDSLSLEEFAMTLIDLGVFMGLSQPNHQL